MSNMSEKLVLPLMMYKEKGSIRKGTKKQMWVVPSWNHLYIIGRKTVILDQWAVKHKEMLSEKVDLWIKETGWQKTEGRKVIVNCFVWFDSALERDVHNLDKMLLDVFNDRIYDDDCNALLRYIDFDLDLENPRFEFTFEVGEAFDRKQRRKELEKQLKAKNKAQKL